MCDIMEKYMDESKQEGFVEGEKKTILSLVADKKLSADYGAEKLNISIEELNALLTKEGYAIS